MSTWRVYEKQWVIVFASDPHSEDAPDVQCQRRFDADYAGKVVSGDAQIAPAMDKEVSRLPWYLKLRLWVMVAEYRKEANSPQWHAAADSSRERIVVLNGSPEERKLTDYGKKKLTVS